VLKTSTSSKKLAMMYRLPLTSIYRPSAKYRRGLGKLFVEGCAVREEFNRAGFAVVAAWTLKCRFPRR
jgi:hypothetical protein